MQCILVYLNLGALTLPIRSMKPDFAIGHALATTHIELSQQQISTMSSRFQTKTIEPCGKQPHQN